MTKNDVQEDTMKFIRPLKMTDIKEVQRSVQEKMMNIAVKRVNDAYLHKGF